MEIIISAYKEPNTEIGCGGFVIIYLEMCISNFTLPI